MTLYLKTLSEQLLDDKAIKGFFGAYRFLSNHHFCDVVLDGETYPTTEHAYQAAKTFDPQLRKQIRELSEPKLAGRLGRKDIELRPDWEEVKYSIMEDLNRQKFKKGTELYRLLKQTSGKHLEETNWWNDTYWGVCEGKGQNMMGKILMKIRDEGLKVLTHDLWDIHAQGYTVCVTTNGVVNKYGENIMGGGTARDCADRYPDFPKWLGTKIETFGNNVFYHAPSNIFTFPTKHHYRDPSSLELIEQSCVRLLEKIQIIPQHYKIGFPTDWKVFLPVPGTGLGGLTEEEVFPILEKYFGGSSNIIIVKKK